MDNIDAILYINLAHRTDRKEHITNELKKICNDETKIHRIEAIYKPELGALGCSMSHLKTLNYILEHENWNNCLILEDDFTFKSDNIEENNNLINTFFKDFPDYECCVLSYNPWNARFENTHIDNIKKTHYSQTTSSYLINRKFIPKLISNFKESILDLITNGNKCYNCLDIHWTHLQPSSNWYMFVPAIGFQIDSYSDIERKFVAYRC
jgi:GR25 family glycosyltransferase involved in LPS biosynthesis